MVSKKWFRFLLSGILLLAITACGGGGAPATSPTESAADTSPAEPDAPSSGGTVHIGWNGSPDTLNPGTAILAEAYIIFDLVYDTMFDLNLDGTLTSNLAESWEVSNDGKTWKFKLKPGINFHDGTPLTAKDVAFTYNFYRSHADFPYMSSYGQTFENVEAADDSTVVITLLDAIPNMESRLFAQYILPEHIWAQYDDPTKAVEFENLEMIGTGPFKMVEYKQNEFVRLVKNEAYFPGPAKVDEVVFQTFGNPDALVQAIATGQVDMITEMPQTAVPTLRNNQEVELVIGAPLGPSVRDIFFNVVTPENCPPEDGVCSGHPALLDRNVRLALAHATDKQNIIDVAVLGLGRPGLTLIPDSMGLWYNNTLQDYQFDIAKANQILDDAGYKDTSGDGIREMPDGSRSLEFRLYWPTDISEAPRIADILSNTWGQIGVKVQPQALDPDALTNVCCPSFDFDIMIWNWSWGPDPDDPLTVYRTSDIPTGNSETGYSNPKFDALYTQQVIELDQEKRREMVWEMQKIVFDDVVYIIPYYPQEVQAFRKDRFSGWITDQPKVGLADPSSLTVIQPVQ